MDKLSKSDLAILWGSGIAGGTASIPLLWTGSANDWVLIALKFLGIIASAGATAFTGILFKYYGEQMVRRIKISKRIKQKLKKKKENEKHKQQTTEAGKVA